MKYIFIFFCFVFICADVREKSFADNNLQKCLDHCCLGFSDNKIIEKLENPTSKVILKSEEDLFVNIFHLQLKKPVIKFSKIYYYKDKYTFFFYNNRVVAFIGYDKDYLIKKNLSILNGVEEIVFKLGNKDLEIIEEKNRALYLYKALGLAFFDDNKDDSIDLFLLFNSNGK